MKGRPALFIANNIVCNPDFDKIRNDNFENYYFEVFTDTYRKYPDSSRVLELFRKGVEAGAILPQFHGREHVHVNRWLKHLRGKDKNFLEAFENGMFTLTYGRNSSCKLECLDAMAIYDERDAQFISHSIREGMAIFRNIWGFDSHSAIPPCYVWDEEVEKIMANHGVKLMQSGRAQLIPGNHGVRQIRRYTGQKVRMVSCTVCVMSISNPSPDLILIGLIQPCTR
ncbi:MAG: hypothetical protein IPM26_05520 [Saprospiraceae bacterium]|nr:hypothetical protein [Saprospiraceae bacterium]